jgi:hypothetical protein
MVNDMRQIKTQTETQTETEYAETENTDSETEDPEIVADGGNRREPLDPAKALLEDAAGL